MKLEEIWPAIGESTVNGEIYVNTIEKFTNLNPDRPPEFIKNCIKKLSTVELMKVERYRLYFRVGGTPVQIGAPNSTVTWLAGQHVRADSWCRCYFGYFGWKRARDGGCTDVGAAKLFVLYQELSAKSKNNGKIRCPETIDGNQCASEFNTGLDMMMHRKLVHHG